MPNSPWLSRRDVPEIDDTSLAALLEGTRLPADAPPPLRPLAETLAALTAPPASDELAGEVAAMAEFRNRLGGQARAGRSHRRRRPLLAPLASARAAVAAGAAALSLGGFATAAFAGGAPRPGPAVRAQRDRRTGGGRQPATRRPSRLACEHSPKLVGHAIRPGRRRPGGIRALHRLVPCQGTRHQQPAGGRLPEPCRRGRRSRQHRRLLRRRAAPRSIVRAFAAPVRPADVAPVRPADVASQRPADVSPHAGRIGPAILASVISRVLGRRQESPARGRKPRSAGPCSWLGHVRARTRIDARERISTRVHATTR
jgi:hypothetical protein